MSYGIASLPSSIDTMIHRIPIAKSNFFEFTSEQCRAFPPLYDIETVADPYLFKWIFYSVKLGKSVLPVHSGLRILVAQEFEKYKLAAYFEQVNDVLKELKLEKETKEVLRLATIGKEASITTCIDKLFETSVYIYPCITKTQICSEKYIWIYATETALFKNRSGLLVKICNRDKTMEGGVQFPLTSVTRELPAQFVCELVAVVCAHVEQKWYALIKVATDNGDEKFEKLLLTARNRQTQTTVSIAIEPSELFHIFKCVTAIDSNGNLYSGDAVVKTCERVQVEVQFPDIRLVDHDWFKQTHTQKQKPRKDVTLFLHERKYEERPLFNLPDSINCSLEEYFGRLQHAGEKIYISVQRVVGTYRVGVHFPETCKYAKVSTLNVVTCKTYAPQICKTVDAEQDQLASGIYTKMDKN